MVSRLMQLYTSRRCDAYRRFVIKCISLTITLDSHKHTHTHTHIHGSKIKRTYVRGSSSRVAARVDLSRCGIIRVLSCDRVHERNYRIARSSSPPRRVAAIYIYIYERVFTLVWHIFDAIRNV
uniref:Uncharacterized protein n=1 Tax=Trichogramma kaykai TaxID=54128 RepID=A0ABD2XLZ2_9HYME